MNLVQSLIGAAAKPERPLHAGEAMSLWAMMIALQDGRTMCLGFLNHAVEPELRSFIEQYVHDFEEVWIKRLKEFMLNNDVPLPAAHPDKPRADARDIPIGGRFTDPEIAGFLAAKVRTGLQMIQQATLECLRYDLGGILMEMQAGDLRHALVLRETMEKHGWMREPPEWTATKISR